MAENIITNGVALNIITSIILFFVAAIAEIGGGYLITIIWGIFVDKKKPDRYEVIGSLTAILGAVIIFYAPR